jgi:uncharacterized OB-fold protein
MTDYKDAYWQYISSGKLCLQFCQACEKYVFYPRARCPYCLQSGLEWKEVSGRGQVYSHTIVHVSALPDFRDETPYIYALIELAGGVKMPSNLIECPIESVRVGLPVELAFIDRMGKILPVFKPGDSTFSMISATSEDIGGTNINPMNIERSQL